MQMKAKISSVFNTPAHRAWSAVKESRTLIFVTKGLLAFEGNFPAIWQEGKKQTAQLRFFGVIPGWQHTLYFRAICDETHQLSTEEGGGLVSIWNHVIKITKIDGQHCRYRDEIDIDAGMLSPFVWLYAHLFYRYRQWRWRKMIKLNYQFD